MRVPGRGDQTARTLRWIAIGALLIGLVALLGDVLLLVFAAALIATVLVRGSRFIARHTGMPRGYALALMVVLALVLVGTVAWWRGPVIIAEEGELVDQLTAHVAALRDRLQGLSWGDELISRARGYLSGQPVAGAVRGIATSTLGLLGTLVVLAATSLYFAASPGLYLNGVTRLLPVPWRERGRAVLRAVGDALAWWFAGQLVDMVLVGLLSYAGLRLLGVPLAGTLATIAALLNFVPYVGAIAGAVPAILVAFGTGTTVALETAALFVAVQTLEGNVIAPLIQRRTIALPPVLTILSQTVFGTLFGPAGLVLATPIAAAAMVVVRMVYVGDVLGDHSAEEGA